MWVGPPPLRLVLKLLPAPRPMAVVQAGSPRALPTRWPHLAGHSAARVIYAECWGRAPSACPATNSHSARGPHLCHPQAPGPSIAPSCCRWPGENNKLQDTLFLHCRAPEWAVEDRHGCLCKSLCARVLPRRTWHCPPPSCLQARGPPCPPCPWWGRCLCCCRCSSHAFTAQALHQPPLLLRQQASLDVRSGDGGSHRALGGHEGHAAVHAQPVCRARYVEGGEAAAHMRSGSRAAGHEEHSGAPAPSCGVTTCRQPPPWRLSGRGCSGSSSCCLASAAGRGRPSHTCAGD